MEILANSPLARFLVLVFIASATAHTGARETRVEQRVFRSGVEVVSLTVTVTDTRGDHVTDLSRSEFEVFEDGVRQDLAFFDGGDTPLDVALLLDISGSMARKMPLVREAAIGLLHRLGPRDRASVFEFDDTVRLLADFTGSIDVLEAAIDDTSPRWDGFTSLYTAVYVALGAFARPAPGSRQVRRQAIVVLSDGSDTASLVSLDDVLDLAKRASVGIYTVSLGSESTARRVQARRCLSCPEAGDVMETLARDSGGRSFFDLPIEDLVEVYDTIAEELVHQYFLGYISTNSRRDGAYRRISVRISTGTNVRARTRRGYFAGRRPSSTLLSRP